MNFHHAGFFFAMEWTFTTIQHGPRRAMDLSNDDYVLLDLIYQTQTNEVFGVDGWCEHSYAILAKVVGIGKGGLHAMTSRLEKKGWIEVNAANPKQKRVNVKFALMAYYGAEEDENGLLIVSQNCQNVQKVNDAVQKVNDAVQKVNDAVQKVNGGRSKSERHIKVITKRKLNTTLRVGGTENDFDFPDAGNQPPVLSDNPETEEPFFPLQAKKNHDQIPAPVERTQESDLSPEETTPPHSGGAPPAFVPDDPNGWAAKMFDPTNKIGYFSTEALDKIFRYYDVDEALLAEARLAGRADLPILALRDLLGRFTTHQNFPAYARQSPDFATLRQHFLRWLKGHRLDLTKVWFTAQELYDAILAKKPALQGVLTMESAALALENYTAWNTAKGLAMDAMLADELAACLVRAGSWAEAMGCMNFFAGRRDFMKNFRRQYEAWKEAWPKYKAEKI